MLSFKEYLTEKANTELSDVNEILVGFYLNNRRWYDKDAQKKYEDRIMLLSKTDIANEKAKAEQMAHAFIAWAKDNGYSDRIKKVYWTARPGSMTSIVRQTVDQSKNPADILVHFNSGPTKGFLGLSAKSVKLNRGLVYKNPALSTIDAALGLKFVDYVKEKTTQIIKKHNLPLTDSKRAEFIKSDVDLKKEIDKQGFILYQHIRNELHDHLKSMNKEDLLHFIFTVLVDADIIFPPYIIVSSIGTTPPFKINVINPIENEKLNLLTFSDISFEKMGVDTVALVADGKKILKIRVKFKAIKFSSSMKFSIEG